jgi:hypothetical protein
LVTKGVSAEAFIQAAQSVAASTIEQYISSSPLLSPRNTRGGRKEALDTFQKLQIERVRTLILILLVEDALKGK